MHYVGAHVSAAKGIHNVFPNTRAINGTALACFVRSQRKWTSTELSHESVEQFREEMSNSGFDPSKILVHGSYLINLANPDKEVREKSTGALLDEVSRCERLGISLYTFHPGSTLGQIGIREGLRLVADCINSVIQSTSKTKILIETMAGQGNTVGKKFEEIAEIISQIEDKSRIGVCLDTCHIFCSGYDIRDSAAWERTLSSFDKTIGVQYLNAVHLNDSKCDLGSNKDRHEKIGKGKIGINAFRFIMNDKRFENMPLVLETPADEELEYREEIAFLLSLQRGQ